MDKRKKRILLLFSISVLLLGGILALLFSRSSLDVEEEEEKQHKELSPQTEEAYKAVPSDAVLIFDFEEQDHVMPMLSDTSTYGYGLFDPSSPLVRFQGALNRKGAGICHSLFSLHYSAINEVSLLQVLDISNSQNVGGITGYIDSLTVSSRSFNSYKIQKLSSGLNVALAGDKLLASTSSICLESSLRHILGGTSILDNQEFYPVLRSTGGSECLYINHKQIGKFFSGTVTYSFLKYSDFIMRMATWSALEINPRQRNYISFEGKLTHNSDFINFSALLGQMKPAVSMAQEILPASTMFAVSINISGLKSYMKDYEKYLDANKKLASRMAEAERIQLPDAPSPADWVSDEGFTEFVSAFCLVGNKYEWLTFLYHNSTSFFGKLTGIKGRGERKEPSEFPYKGYLASLLGEAFSHNPEEQYCKMGDWTIIGSAAAIGEFFKGKANAVTLDKYLDRTPASSFFSEKGVAKVIVNIKEGSDTLFTVLNKYYRSRFASSIKKKNFEYATANVVPTSEGTELSLNFYAALLNTPPAMFDALDEDVVFIDSTFKTFWGPFPLVDENSDTTWFEQSRKYLSISYMDKNKKGIWGIPMKDTIKNYAGLVSLGEKPHITFILGNKLYMMSRRGAHYTGYPKELDVGVSLGPLVIRENGEQHLLILTDQNIITKRTLSGEPCSGWTDIHAPEFTRELPQEQVILGKRYYILRTVSKLRIYTPDGEEITAKNVKRPISRDSAITEEEDGYIKVMGVDGKEFLFNLKTGRIKKL
ncbi:MAG: hypothetical protein II157_05250 [Bacteroidales bacterium]|nr:hypothetical protein [Bacteroidales bacterium]